LSSVVWFCSLSTTQNAKVQFRLHLLLNLTLIVRLNAKTGLIEPSYAELKEIKPMGALMLRFLDALHLVDITRSKSGVIKTVNNLTLINLVLCKFGPAREDQVVLRIVAIHVLCNLFGLYVRYGLVYYLL
jgi:hypothetical protein